MKLLRISSVPAKQLTKINEEFDTVGEKNYDAALDTYFHKFIATSNAIVHELNKTGQCIANEVIYNHKKLQNLWLEKYGNKNNTLLGEADVLAMQIAFYDPDIIFVNAGNLFSYEQLKKAVKKNVFLISWDGYIKPSIDLNSKYDLVLTCLDSISSKYRGSGTKSEVLDFAFDKRVLDFITTNKTETLNFVGNFNYVHAGRQSFIKSLINKKIDFSLYIGNYNTGNNIFSRTMLREILQNKRLKSLVSTYNFQKVNHGGVYGLDMYNAIAQSVSTLNFHGDEVDKACNMRLFEATGVGTCLITDDKPGLEKFFKAGEEVVVFKNEKDLVDKVIYLQENKAGAEKIGLAGQQRIFSQHLWSHRVIDLLKIINENI